MSKITEEITKQIEMYRYLKTEIDTLENVLQLQLKMQVHHTIPKQFKPACQLQILHPNKNSIQTTFSEDFENIFFPYLNKAIATNTITMEIQKAKLHDVITTTESLLIKSEERTEILQQQYIHFLKSTPALSKKLQVNKQSLYISSSVIPQTRHT